MVKFRDKPILILTVALLLLFGLIAFSGCAPEAEPEEPEEVEEEPEEEPEEDPEDEPEEEPVDEPERGGSINIAFLGADVTPPDVHDAATISDHVGATTIADPLLTWKDEEYIPLLAEDWDISEDGTTYTFYLRQGVQFHNGVELDAEVVKANIDRITDPEDPRPAAGGFALVEEVEVVDSHTISFHLETMHPDFLNSFLTAWMLEPGSWEDDDWPVGTGAFRVVGHAEDEYLKVERNEDYWAGEPYLDDITFRAIPDPGTMVLELETGGADLILFAPPKDGARLEEEGFEVMPFGRVNWARLAFNMQTVEDVRLRRAICYGINRQAIIDVAYAGTGIPMDTLVVPDSWAYDLDVPRYDYDPDRAREILDEAGFVDTTDDGIREMNGEAISLHLPTRGDDEAWLRTTQMIQEMMFDIGVGTQITTAARLSYYSEVRTGNYDITWWLSNAAPEPPVAWGNLDSASYWNITQLPDDHPIQVQMDELIAAGRSTIDQTERARHFNELHNVVYEEAVEALGKWIHQIYVAQPNLQDLYIAPSGVMYEAHLWRLTE